MSVQLTFIIKLFDDNYRVKKLTIILNFIISDKVDDQTSHFLLTKIKQKRPQTVLGYILHPRWHCVHS